MSMQFVSSAKTPHNNNLCPSGVAFIWEPIQSRIQDGLLWETVMSKAAVSLGRAGSWLQGHLGVAYVVSTPAVWLASDLQSFVPDMHASSIKGQTSEMTYRTATTSFGVSEEYALL